ncbi:MAG: LPXTG cell wall anchor domain-containing protein, partial [Thermoplasmata archaeon]|nr:LPXTG cell wall anchor domain-containing protein [Thermoplasmata archaeon]NIS12680.1 LPXTG cell wall anchor domain-containing protein [Thermoplasmata archaeon]NIS20604.1 LPXTG cell wall anchor domain-containing protein [Thermoplasmata archaeon]NIT77984.1 LPXTG cell wall anchor domain-containing protein [Thermoplasmata archaeon]NIU49682.1 LPXTG cell wall anchor domain-containing protein [Thermoplasmata archaeon]
MVESNEFNITFYLAGDDPGPGPGPDTPGVQGPSGGSVWVLVALVAIAAVLGGAWMYYRRKKPS